MARPIPPAFALPLLLALPLSAATQAPAPAVHVPFVEGKPFSEVLARAQKEKKPVMLDVVASWCNPCKWMDRTTFSDPGVVSWVKAHAVPARVDAEKGEGRKIAGRYAVSSFPTVLFLDAHGDEIDRVLGAQPAGQFEKLGDKILEGQGPLAVALAELKTKFSLDTAIGVVEALGQRNDLARVRPVALRIVTEDPDLTDSRTVGALAVLATMEDRAGKVTPETGDLIETYLPKLGADPRRGILAIVFARELVRRGDAAELRAFVGRQVPALPRDAYLADLWGTLGEGEAKAGKPEAAVDAFRKSIAILEEQNIAPQAKVVRQLQLAEALADGKKTAEARETVAKAIASLPNEPEVLARAATVQVRTGQKDEALKNARQAVELSRGENAYTQAALARVLSATGDAKGAQAAWNRAHLLDPDNPEYGKPLGKSSASS